MVGTIVFWVLASIVEYAPQEMERLRQETYRDNQQILRKVLELSEIQRKRVFQLEDRVEALEDRLGIMEAQAAIRAEATKVTGTLPQWLLCEEGKGCEVYFSEYNAWDAYVKATGRKVLYRATQLSCPGGCMNEGRK